MKFTFRKIALLMVISLSAFALVSCQSFPSRGFYGSEPRDWDFIQSVGGIKLGDPYKLNGMTWVPILFDVSGNQAITVQPTNSNTGLACAQIMTRRSGNSTSLAIYTIDESSLPPNANQSRSCDAILFRAGLGLRGFMTQSIYYGHGDEKKLIGTVNPFDAT
tara:strand:+ start:2033 stop:2518 length:486 start_codon:yes stop_codon:yes gene_type:complete